MGQGLNSVEKKLVSTEVFPAGMCKLISLKYKWINYYNMQNLQYVHLHVASPWSLSLCHNGPVLLCVNMNLNNCTRIVVRRCNSIASCLKSWLLSSVSYLWSFKEVRIPKLAILLCCQGLQHYSWKVKRLLSTDLEYSIYLVFDVKRTNVFQD